MHRSASCLVNGDLLFGQIVTGLVTGGGYAVVAIGLSYTLGLARVMNFAFGSFYMLGAFIAAFLIAQFQLPYVAAGMVTLIVIAILGWVFSRVVVISAMKISEAAVMIATLGVSVAIANLAQAVFGADVSYIPTPSINVLYHFGSATVTQQAIIVLVAAPVIAAVVSSLMSRTILGTRIRAAAEAPALAAVTGVNVPQVQMIAVVIGIVLAALAALLYAPVTVISVFMGDEILLKAFAITALAGIGQLWGALAVALGIGIFESLFTTYVDPSYSTAAIYALLVLTLAVLPRGIFRGH